MPTTLVRRGLAVALPLLLTVGSLATAMSPSTAAPVGAYAASSPDDPASATDGGSVFRVDGASRYQVAVGAADTVGLVSPPVTVIASGQVFPDAMTAGALAGRIGAPVLLTRRGSLPQASLDAARRYAWPVTEFVVVGGPATVDEGVVAELERHGQVQRIGGANRYQVAAAVARFRATGPVPVVYVATGAGYADALSAVSPAAVGDGPVLLTQRTSLPSATREVLRTLRPGRIVVLGGAASVSRGVLTALKGYTTGSVTRIGGATRYDVSAAVSAATFEPGARVAYLASGEVFPDALAGGPYAGLQGGPVLLVRRGGVPEPVMEELERLRPRRIVVLGGSDTISAAVLHAVAGIAQPATATDLSMSAHGAAACAVAAGRAECWGYGKNQLGNGSRAGVSVPVPVRGLTAPVTQVSVGFYNACALDADGGTWCWGKDPLEGPTRFRPERVAGLPAATTVSAGADATCAVDELGTVWCWGDNDSGQLGTPGPDTDVPQEVPGIEGHVADVSVGDGYACAVTDDDDLWCWGSTGYGRTGTDPTSAPTIPPTRVDLGGSVASLAARATQTCVTLVAGGVRCVGQNSSGQLGVGSTTDYSWQPVTPTGLASANGSVETSTLSSCLADGTVICWGGEFPELPTPQPQLGDTVAEVAPGWKATCARSEEGVLLCTGGGPLTGVPWTPGSTVESVRVTGY